MISNTAVSLLEAHGIPLLAIFKALVQHTKTPLLTTPDKPWHTVLNPVPSPPPPLHCTSHHRTSTTASTC